MGGQKRSFEATEVVEEGERDAPTSSEVVARNKPKKKSKNEKGKGKDFVDGAADPSASVKPMERRKKRKGLDKERHRTAAEQEKPEPKELEIESKPRVSMGPSLASSSSSSGPLPEFHISVFKDLASADASVREAAAEALVTELQEVQKAYDRLEAKELVDGGLKLEAEKDDGLNDCAPSLRYAVRRLIRGVSSSREVCFV